jgi:hypothetical protein
VGLVREMMLRGGGRRTGGWRGGGMMTWSVIDDVAALQWRPMPGNVAAWQSGKWSRRPAILCRDRRLLRSTTGDVPAWLGS